MTLQFKGTEEAVNGYQGRPELRVTHKRYRIDQEWGPCSWPTILQGYDFILCDTYRTPCCQRPTTGSMFRLLRSGA